MCLCLYVLLYVLCTCIHVTYLYFVSVSCRYLYKCMGVSAKICIYFSIPLCICQSMYPCIFLFVCIFLENIYFFFCIFLNTYLRIYFCMGICFLYACILCVCIYLSIHLCVCACVYPPFIYVCFHPYIRVFMPIHIRIILYVCVLRGTLLLFSVECSLISIQGTQISICGTHYYKVYLHLEVMTPFLCT